jgi:hypothetical protein
MQRPVGVYLEDPISIFVPWTMASFFSLADIVFSSLCSPLSVCRCVAHISNRLSKRFSPKNLQSDFLCIAVIKRAWNREAASMNSPRL